MNLFPWRALRIGVLGHLLASTLLSAGASGSQEPSAPERPDHTRVRGMTISCQTSGPEWGTPGFALELDRLRALGVNWVAIHPYASIRADGSVQNLRGELDPTHPPAWIQGPIEAAHARGLSILVKPHLAYWGSPFRWRGEIEFAEEEARDRFWRQYEDWIVAMAQATRQADGFCIGTELDRMLGGDAPWARVIERVRSETDALLTYAANWDSIWDVPFWGSLDAIGVQAYFPLSRSAEPSDEVLRSAWRDILGDLRGLHERTGKPVVFTELGYDAWSGAAREPWKSGSAGEHTGQASVEPASVTAEDRRFQVRLLSVALEAIEAERDWLRGAFLWKWFVGRPGRGDHAFYLDHPEVRQAISSAWR